MDTLLSLKIFAQIVESGSFTRAAECLGISTAMASKHLSHLEKHLGIRLMQRNTSKSWRNEWPTRTPTSLTPNGLLLDLSRATLA